MATVADRAPAPMGADHRFFVGGAVAMTLLIVAGFSVNVGTGRSSFDAPLLLHAHAVVFMGWLGIYLLQNIFAATGRTALHKRLGWLAAVWIAPMLVLGFAVTLAIVRRGEVPFFFRPLPFLIFDPVALLTFAGLTGAAIVLRRQTDWHRRLHFCAMAMLLGPGVGRLLPMPLMTPWAWEASFIVCLLFPLAGVAADLRRSGRVHPAWGWGIATLVGSVLLTEAITYSPAGQAIYRVAVAGSPGAAVPALAFPAPPPGFPPPT